MPVKKDTKKILIKAAVIVIWILIWQLVAVIINNSLILASPIDAFLALINLVPQGSFWLSVWGSFYNITAGFLLAAVLGVVLSFLSYKVNFVKEFLSPPMTLLKTVPVASFIILLLISMKSKANLSMIISFMMVLPVIYVNMLAGFNNLDKKLLEMADMFKVSGRKKLKYIYVYETLPFFTTGAKISLGLCFKSGVAAELVGLVQNTIGNELYYTKLYLMMDNVFAWTAVIIVISILFEALILNLLKLLKRSIEK